MSKKPKKISRELGTRTRGQRARTASTNQKAENDDVCSAPDFCPNYPPNKRCRNCQIRQLREQVSASVGSRVRSSNEGNATAAPNAETAAQDTPLIHELQRLEEIVYGAYVVSRELLEKRPYDRVELGQIQNALHATRRFIFDTYGTGSTRRQ